MVYYQACPSERPYGMMLMCCHRRLESAHMSPNTAPDFSPQFSRKCRKCWIRPWPGTSLATRSVRIRLLDVFYLRLTALLSAGYEFLMQHCECFVRVTSRRRLIIRFSDQYGDKICIFGFSRGAYTARALAGMLAKVDHFPSLWLEDSSPPLLGRASPRG